MKNPAKARIALFLFVLLALAACAACALGEGEYRILQEGSYGDDVLAVKERLYRLGYFTGSSFNNRYTADTAARLKAFEAACGLPETGVATPALQTLLFSDDAVSKKTGKNASGNPPALPGVPDSIYRTIGEGASGDDVLALKERLLALGLFTAKAETANYNKTLAAAISEYQLALGVRQTGVADPALQESLFAAAALPLSPTPAPAAPGATPDPASAYAVVPTAVPLKATAPTSTPIGPSVQPTLPELTAGNFLADPAASPYVYADRDNGLWYYISQNLHIHIARMYNKRQNITWFEVEIFCTPDSMPQAFLAQGSKQDGHNYLSPKVLAAQYDAIFAISDDFYGHRWYNKVTQGVIIRNGEIKADAPTPKVKWPYLDVLALFSDGSMRVYGRDEHTAQEYLDMGVIDTFAFGPVLVKDGIIDQGLYDKTVVRYTDDEPRMALGCVEPYHYIAVAVKGRTSDSDGVTMHWLAERMKALGCENALNLDGGNTVALYFMGDVLNKVKNSTSYRDLSSMFGFAAQ